MGLMLISVDCVLCFKTGKCADESHTINEAYHLMASQPSLWLTEKALAKCHGGSNVRYARGKNDPQSPRSVVITADSRVLKTPPRRFEGSFLTTEDILRDAQTVSLRP